jgi:hypothetical protein
VAVNPGKPVNSEKLDYCPFVDVPRGNFYFTSERGSDHLAPVTSVSDFVKQANQPGNGLGDLYRVRYELLLK